MGWLVLIIASIIGFKINAVIGLLVLGYGVLCISASSYADEPKKKDNMETYYTFRFGPFSVTKKDKGND